MMEVSLHLYFGIWIAALLTFFFHVWIELHIHILLKFGCSWIILSKDDQVESLFLISFFCSFLFGHFVIRAVSST